MAIETRRNVRSSAPEQIAEYRKAVREIQGLNDTRGYNHLAGLHGAPGSYCWHHQRRAGVVEGVRLFLPWHRAYLYRFEQALQDRVERVTVPWWDWRSDRSRSAGLPAAFSEERVGGQPNALFDARVWVPSAGFDFRTVRYSRAPSGLPSADVVQRLIDDLDDWADFNDALESLHDRIHGWVGGFLRDAQGWPVDESGNRIADPMSNQDLWIYGTMGTTTAAAFDPIFWSHHCMIDRIWSLWQLEHGDAGISSNVLDLVLEPFNMRVRDVLDIQELGYEYVGTSVDVPGNG